MHKNRWHIPVLILWMAFLCAEAWFFEVYMGDSPALGGTVTAPDECTVSEDEAALTYLAKDIYLDGLLTDNYRLEHQILEYKSDYYFPATEIWQKALGFRMDADAQEGIILLEPAEKEDIALAADELRCNDFDKVYMGNTVRDRLVMVCPDMEAEGELTRAGLAAEAEDSRRIKMYSDKFPWLGAIMRRLGIKEHSRNLEVLYDSATHFEVDGTLYFPFRWFEKSERLGWSSRYSPVSGLYVSTDAQMDASSWFSENNESYISGLAAYMTAWNPELSPEEALYFEYIFRHEAWVNGLEEHFLLALCRGEGMFRPGVIGGGAVGMMQIMPGTGAAYGYDMEKLLDPHYNVEFGARYVAGFLRAYGGDVIVALSAYNQGAGQVSTGLYDTDYAERILIHRNNLIAWVYNRGYSTEFFTDLRPGLAEANQ